MIIIEFLFIFILGLIIFRIEPYSAYAVGIMVPIIMYFSHDNIFMGLFGFMAYTSGLLMTIESFSGGWKTEHAFNIYKEANKDE
jgi:hypothetical protein